MKILKQLKNDVNYGENGEFDDLKTTLITDPMYRNVSEMIYLNNENISLIDEVFVDQDGGKQFVAFTMG